MEQFDAPLHNSAEPVLLIKCRITQRYFAREGWTFGRSLADKYSDETEATRAVIDNDLRDVDIVLPAAPGHDTDFVTKRFC